MKKFILFVIAAGVLAGGTLYVSQLKLSLGFTEGKLDKVTRGDLVIPITASGSIEPASVTNIKSEASGEVVKLPFQLGEIVKKGELIVELNEEDELRTVERAQSDVARAKIALAKARLAREEKEKVMIPLSVAEREQAEAVAERIEALYERTRKYTEEVTNDMELIDNRSRHQEAKAAVAAAKAKEEQARIALELADEDIKSAAEALKTAENTLEDAQERLSETKIMAPADSMVLSQNIQIGEVVLSGTKSLTGGTLLMQLADVSRIYAVVNVDEADIGRVRELAPPEARPGNRRVEREEESGARLAASTQPAESDSGVEPFNVDKDQEVEVTVESFEDEKFYGVIERISPQAELVRAIATFKVWIRITSANRDKLVGQMNTQAEAKFTVNAVDDALLVNWEAMRPNPDGEGYGVFVPVKNPESGREEPEFRQVEFGVSDGIHIEVIEGLEEGDQVYIELPIKTAKQAREEREAGKK